MLWNRPENTFLLKIIIMTMDLLKIFTIIQKKSRLLGTCLPSELAGHEYTMNTPIFVKTVCATWPVKLILCGQKAHKDNSTVSDVLGARTSK